MLAMGSPVLNNDMLVAYFCYFWDFHANWSIESPLVFWSSSYQTGMPMHAYWQSGYLYPITWVLFGPISPHIGIHLFYAFHFALAVFGFMALGPRLALKKPAALWGGLAFGLGGTMLARYEHATFLAGWAWMPLVLAAFLALRDKPGFNTLFAYAFSVAMQALGGHPQASATTAVLIGVFTVAALFRRRKSPGNPSASTLPATLAPKATTYPVAWLAAGHFLALLYCAPLVVPFLGLVERTNRFDGAAWEGNAQEGTASEKLETGVFGFEKFSTGGLRPLHLLSLGAAHALGSPSNASWWGGEVWGEVFLYMGVLGLFFAVYACFASLGRAGPDLRLLWLVGLLGLWFSFGAHLGASQVLYQVPVFNNFRRPARFLILVAFALAALSAHGFQRWTLRPHGLRARARVRARVPMVLTGVGLLGALVFLALRTLPEAQGLVLDGVHWIKKLDPAKDYAAKVSALAGRLAMDFALVALSGAALWTYLRGRASAARPGTGPHSGSRSCSFSPSRPRLALAGLFAVLVLDLVRLHWDHFYLFPSSFYRTPPVTAASLDTDTRAFWRVSSYLEYEGLEMWRMHNDPLAALPLFEREKEAMSYGIHAVFGYDHVSAHLPLVWKWEEGTGMAARGGRYLFANRDLIDHEGEALRSLGRHQDVRIYEIMNWRPRFERRTATPVVDPGGATPTSEPRATIPAVPAVAFIPEAATPVDPLPPDPPTPCPPGHQGFRGLCVHEVRDGRVNILGSFSAGDTLLFRERAYPGWLYRVDQGPWQVAQETPEHFLAAPLQAEARSIEFAFIPFDLYYWAGIGLLVTGLVAIFAFFRRYSRNPANRENLSVASIPPPP